MTFSWSTPIYLLALYGLLRFFIFDSKAKQTKNVNWSPFESVALTLFFYFGGQLIGGLLLSLPLTIFGWTGKRIEDWAQNNTLGQFLFICLIEACTVGLLLWFLKRRKLKLEVLGWVKRPKISDAGLAILMYAAYFVCFLVIIQIAKTIFPALNLDQKQQIGFEAVRSIELPLVFISLVILPPLVEELLIRGFLYSSLKATSPKFIAVIITSLLFSVAHLQAGSGAPLLWVAAIDTFVLSLFLIYVRDRTKSLWAPIMLHALKNGVAFLFLFVLVK